MLHLFIHLWGTASCLHSVRAVYISSYGCFRWRRCLQAEKAIKYFLTPVTNYPLAAGSLFQCQPFPTRCSKAIALWNCVTTGVCFWPHVTQNYTDPWSIQWLIFISTLLLFLLMLARNCKRSFEPGLIPHGWRQRHSNKRIIQLADLSVALHYCTCLLKPPPNLSIFWAMGALVSHLLSHACVFLFFFFLPFTVW